MVPIILKCVKLNSIPMGNEPDVSNTFLVFKMSSIHRLCKNIDLARHKFYLNKKTSMVMMVIHGDCCTMMRYIGRNSNPFEKLKSNDGLSS